LPGVDAELDARSLGDRRAASPHDPRLDAAPVEARLDAPAEAHLAREALDAPRELGLRQQTAGLQVQGIGDAHASVPGRERRLEHVRPPHVASLGVEAALGLERKTTA